MLEVCILSVLVCISRFGLVCGLNLHTLSTHIKHAAFKGQSDKVFQSSLDIQSFVKHLQVTILFFLILVNTRKSVTLRHSVQSKCAQCPLLEE